MQDFVMKISICNVQVWDCFLSLYVGTSVYLGIIKLATLCYRN